MKLAATLLGLSLGMSLYQAASQPAVPPALVASREPDGRLRLRPATAASITLEETDSLTAPVQWRAATATPDPATAPPSFLVQPTVQDRFFRAVAAPAQPVLTRVGGTSPASGETGVSVTRETIFRFTAPLAAGVLLNSGNLRAEAGGRTVLARAELSSDRLSATLFLLEDLPAGALVRVTLDADGLSDEQGKLLDADGDGEPGGRRVAEFTTFNATPIAGTAVIGRVFASELVPGTDTGTNAVNTPLRGVTITVDGFEQTLRTTTDANGNFTLNNCPAGRFFVHVDGRTAVGSSWPGGAYYPLVGKAWEAKPGVLTNPAAGTGLIYLPRIRAGTLQPVSATQDTPITFPPEVVAANPALAGVGLVVPANSLFADNGTRGGRVGIAAVPPDRLPEPLPTGLDFPLVITVQTDGAQNFDRPVPARFPNLPDPITGVKLPPGAKTGLWSFNHDTGRWELQGPMTISADGNFADTDPGVGIRQPGWHGPNRGTEGSGGPTHANPPKEDDDDCDCDDVLKLAGMETLLLQIGTGMNALPPFLSENYGGEMLQHFLLDQATPINHGPGSDMAKDVVNSQAYQREQAAIGAALQNKIAEAIAQNPNTPTVSDFEYQDQGLSFYDEGTTLPHKLGAAFGNLSKGDVKIDLQNVQVQRNADGTYSYSADVSLNLSEVYEFNSNDPEGLSAMAGCLQGCGWTKPFTTTVNANTGISGTIPAPRRLERALADEPHLETGDPLLAWPVTTTTEKLFGNQVLIVTPEGEQFFGRADDTQSGPHYFVIENATSGAVILRGIVSGEGASEQSVILPPETRVRRRLAQLPSMRTGTVEFATPTSGQRFTLPRTLLAASRAIDSDLDGVPRDVEEIVGTDPAKADSDGDGLSDGAELLQGSDPLDNRPVRTGIVASADTDGQALDLTVNEELAVLALNNAGVALLRVQPGGNPTLLAQMDTAGQALGVARSGNRVLVGDGTAGVAILDVTDPAAPGVAHLLPAGSDGTFAAVAAADGVGYAGSSTGRILMVELNSGRVLGNAKLATKIEDLSVTGDQLYALVQGTLHVLARDTLQQLGTVATPGTVNSANGRMRLFVDGRTAYPVHTRGYNTIEVSNPSAPVLQRNTTTPQFGWKQIVLNGSGLGVAAVSPNQAFDGRHDVSLYNTADPTKTDVFLTEFVTPGVARAVAIYRGQAYVADHLHGLQVVNYLAFDGQGAAPTISLVAGFPLNPGSLEQGRRVFVRAETTDDVQVRDVEFYRDGALVFTDGSYPFEHHFTAPRGAAGFTLRAKATDTGGNTAWTDEFAVTLTPDVTGPRPLGLTPAENTTAADALYSVSAFLDQPVDPATVTAGALQVYRPGPDAILGTADDQPVAGTVTVNATGDTVMFTPDAVALASGSYRAVVRPSLQDLDGNPVTERAWNFTVNDQTRPKLAGSSPAPGERPDQPVTSVTVSFNEPLNSSTDAATLTLTGYGADGRLGTADDVVVRPMSIEPQPAEFSARFTLPEPLAPMRWRAELAATVADLSGNRLLDPREWHFLVLPRTTFTGRAVFADGSPANGATVRIHERVRPLGEVAAGGFRFPDTAFEPGTRVTLDVQGEAGGRVFLGQVRGVQPVPGGVTDVGTVTLREVCAPQLDPTVLPAVTAPESVNAFVVFDDGSGPALYAAGMGQRFIGNRRESGVYRRRGPHWERVGGEFTTADIFSVQVLSLAVFNDGSGPALYAGGRFDAAGGTAAENVARWNGQQWLPLGGGIGGGEKAAYALAPYDSGTGPRLYVGGDFTTAGGLTTGPIAAWDGQGWSALPGGTFRSQPRLTVRALAVFDEGQGSRLFVGGQFLFERIGATVDRLSYNLARWDGAAWATVGGSGLQTASGQGALVQSLTVAAVGGTPPALYAGGTFTKAGELPVAHVARWNGTAWSALPGGNVTPVGGITSLLPWTETTGTSLVAGGGLEWAGGGGQPARQVGLARWTGTGWTLLNGSADQVVATEGVTALARLEDALFVGSGVTGVMEDPAGKLRLRGVAHWDGQRWQPGDAGLDGQVQCLAEFDAGQGVETYVGGNFVFGDGQRLSGIARLDAVGRLHPLGEGLKGIVKANSSGPSAMVAYDDGSGPALYVIGIYDDHNGGGVPELARWNGTAWSSVGAAQFTLQGFPGALSALAVFDDGTGPSLYVGGWFDKVGAKSISCLARWNGSEWLAAGNPQPVQSLTVFDDGSEPALYVAGTANSNYLMRWNGRTLSNVGNWTTAFGSLPRNLSGFAVLDTQTGPMLHVAADFFDPVTRNSPGGVARWNGAAWQKLPPVSGTSVFGFGGGQHRLGTFDDGFGPALYLNDANNGRNWIRWNGAAWEALPEGPRDLLDGITTSFLPVNGGATPSLFFGGFWTDEAGSRFLLRWGRPSAPCR